ncbi:MAG: DUF4097 family beta strand repeat-containing protein [Gemmatimonadales bacterium]
MRVEVMTGGADAGQLKVEADDGTRRVGFPGDRIRYPPMEHGGSTTLHVDEDGTFDGDHRGTGRRVRISRDQGDFEAWADLRISVPAGRSVELYLAVGRIAAANVNGRLRIEAAAAPVTVAGGKGDLPVSTASGDVTATDVESPRLRTHTGSGDVVSIVAPPSTSARLDIETGSGDIESDFPLAATRSGRHHLTGTIGDGRGRVSVGTGSGGVRLLRAKRAQASAQNSFFAAQQAPGHADCICFRICGGMVGGNGSMPAPFFGSS